MAVKTNEETEVGMGIEWVVIRKRAREREKEITEYQLKEFETG